MVYLVYISSTRFDYEYFLVTFIKFDLSVDLMRDYKVPRLQLIEATN